ncbi:MAG: hypothetical protein AB1646_01115 [Thermodesulfobacteriota bacterium]
MRENPEKSAGTRTDHSLRSAPAPSAVRIKAALLLALGLVHVVVTFVGVVPGYLLSDEAFYHWMTRVFVDTGGLALWNGFEEFPSAELTHRYILITNGTLYPQYPNLFPILAAPLFSLWGYFGLFLMNSAAFLGSVGLVYVIARKLFRDLDLALNSCLILVGGTFLWEYSHAAWPHCTALFFELLAFTVALHAFLRACGPGSRLWCVASGLVIGFSVGVRLDAILMLPALVLPFLFARPWRPWDAGMIGLGMLPGLAALAVANMTKFGVLNPFAYSHAADPARRGMDILAVLCAALLLCGWMLTRSRFVAFTRRHGLKVVCALCALAVAGLVWLPAALEAGENWVRGLYVLVVDTRAADMTLPLGPRSSSGSVVHMGAHKQALLQSLPYLAALLVPMLRIVRKDCEWPFLATLSVVPLTYIGFYAGSFLSLDAGGLCLNARFLIPCLPFIAILTAYSLRELGNGQRLGNAAIRSGTLAVVGAVSFVLLRQYGARTDLMEFPILSVPLWIAGLLGAAVLAREILAPRARLFAGRVAQMLLVAGLVWAGAVGFLYDYPYHRAARDVHWFFTQEAIEIVPRHSILFTDHRSHAPALGLVDKGDIRIALPMLDGFKDFPALLRFQLTSGRRAFGLFTNPHWEELKAGPLKGYRVSPWLVSGGYSIREISVRPIPLRAPTETR